MSFVRRRHSVIDDHVARIVGLAQSARSADRRRAAMHPFCPPTVLIRLSHDQAGSVREAVAANPATPPRVLAGLWSDDDMSVRSALAHNPSSPPGALLGSRRMPAGGRARS